jgi:glycosyltransferase involved in cell wall biosynthesis
VTAPSFAIVICAYTEARWGQLEEAVRSVERQSLPAGDTAVVIDHNVPLLARARAAFGGVRVLASNGQQGLSGARNTGLRAVDGEVVAFLDDDAVAAPEWLERLAGAFADERVLGAGGWIAPRWQGREPRWLASDLYWIVGCSYRGLPGDGAELRNPIGANMAFRRSTLLALEGFREGVGRVGARPLGDEETELGIALHARWPHARIVHVPAARVRHWVPAERASWRYLRSRCWAEGRSKALLTQHVGAPDALASERRYATRVLPAGVWRGVSDGLRGDRCGFARAASIVLALSTTALGYAAGRLARLLGA